MERTMEQMAEMERHTALPDGFIDRPATMDDLPAAVEIGDACDLDVIGQSTGFARRFEIFWTHPDCEIERDIRVVENLEGRVVAFAHVTYEPPYVRARVIANVAPEYQGRGLGSFITEWARVRSAEVTQQRGPAGARLTMHSWAITQDESSKELLREQGLRVCRHFVFMLTDLDGRPDEPAWPDGVELRPLSLEDHMRSICRADEEVFTDHWGHVSMPEEQAMERWQHWIDNDPEIDLSLWFVAWSRDEIAGMSL